MLLDKVFLSSLSEGGRWLTLSQLGRGTEIAMFEVQDRVGVPRRGDRGETDLFVASRVH